MTVCVVCSAVRLSPQWDPGAKPLVGGQGAKPLEAVGSKFDWIGRMLSADLSRYPDPPPHEKNFSSDLN